MKRSIRRSSRFKRDVKKLLQKGKDIEKLLTVIGMLAEKRKLPSKYQGLPLTGNYKNKRDCHIEPDWILIYGIEEEDIITFSNRNVFRTFQVMIFFISNGDEIIIRVAIKSVPSISIPQKTIDVTIKGRHDIQLYRVSTWCVKPW